MNKILRDCELPLNIYLNMHGKNIFNFCEKKLTKKDEKHE